MNCFISSFCISLSKFRFHIFCLCIVCICNRNCVSLCFSLCTFSYFFLFFVHGFVDVLRDFVSFCFVSFRICFSYSYS
jgi:hypothetical protein